VRKGGGIGSWKRSRREGGDGGRRRLKWGRKFVDRVRAGLGGPGRKYLELKGGRGRGG